MAENDVLLWTERDGVATLTLNRPRVHNAMNGALHHALAAGLARAGADEAVRVVVIAGAGRSFSAGGDIKAVAAGEDVGDPVDLALAIWNLPKPVVAAVHGFCLGQAWELAAVCDLTIAAAGATFGEVEINHGWAPPVLITPFAVGLKHAKEVLLLGEMLDADWALRAGVVNRVVPDGDLPAAVDAVTRRLAGLDPSAVAKNKRLVNRTYEKAQLLSSLRMSSEAAG